MIIRRRIIRVTLSQIVRIFRIELFLLKRCAILDWRKRHGFVSIFNPQNYYCGITNDISRREREHNASFLGFIEVENVHIARSIEIAMKFHFGFDTGRRAGNGGQPDSVFLYIYRKIPKVTREIVY